MMCRNGQGMTQQATAAGERRCLLRNASGHVVEGVAKIQRLAKVDAADVGGIADGVDEQAVISAHRLMRFAWHVRRCRLGAICQPPSPHRGIKRGLEHEFPQRLSGVDLHAVERVDG